MPSGLKGHRRLFPARVRAFRGYSDGGEDASRLTVIGSINLDFVATAPRLPRAGETVTGATLARHPGGKAANHSAMPEHLSARIETPLILQLELPTRDEVEESLA